MRISMTVKLILAKMVGHVWIKLMHFNAFAKKAGKVLSVISILTNAILILVKITEVALIRLPIFNANVVMDGKEKHVNLKIVIAIIIPARMGEPVKI